MNTIARYHRPGLLVNNVFNNIFDELFENDFTRHLQESTQGYPVADIYREEDGATILEFALAGFKRDELSIDVQQDKRSITVSANSENEESQKRKRIARRNFSKTYVNFDNNLDLSSAAAVFENGLLTIRVPQRPELKPLSIEIT